MNLEESKVLMNIEKYGNTTSATLPLVLYDFEHLFKKGSTIILAAFGGFTWGSVYLKWAYDKKL
jgi:3-oxoacyl-[acyl-carrier-protein] synthase-3